MIEDAWTLPMSSFESSVVSALFCDFNLFVDFTQLGINFFLALRAHALRLAHSNPPIIGLSASIISANGSRIIDMVTIRSYFRTRKAVETEAANRIEE